MNTKHLQAVRSYVPDYWTHFSEFSIIGLKNHLNKLGFKLTFEDVTELWSYALKNAISSHTKTMPKDQPILLTVSTPNNTVMFLKRFPDALLTKTAYYMPPKHRYFYRSQNSVIPVEKDFDDPNVFESVVKADDKVHETVFVSQILSFDAQFQFTLKGKNV